MKWGIGAALGVALIATVIAVVSVFAGGPPSRSSIEAKPAKTKRIGGPLLRDPRAVLLAARADDVLVGVAARAGRVELVAVPSDVKRIPARAIRVLLSGRVVGLAPCGIHCFGFDARVLSGAPAFLVVEITRRGRVARAALRLPAAPPRAAGVLFRSVDRRMRGLRTVRVDEVLSSGQNSVRTRFALRAPNRMTYVTSVGDKAIVIGPRRWDWDGKAWAKSETQPLPEPSYVWSGAERPRLLGRSTVGGKPVAVLGVFNPDARYPAWFRLYVARDNRVVRAQMFAPAHFMLDRFSAFNAPLAINPPS